MIVKIILFLFLFLCSIIVSYQDFKDRLISLWAILLYTVCCVVSVLLFQNTTSLIYNSISTLVYFAFVFCVLFLYYFVKERKFVNIIDSKIGLGDILIFIAIGLTFDIFYLIIFFTISFCIAAVVALFLAKKNETVPLAGILVWCYFVFQIRNQISIW